MKILDDIKQQVEKEMLKFNPRLAEKKYMKITQSIKAIWAEFRSKNQKKKKKIKEDSD